MKFTAAISSLLLLLLDEATGGSSVATCNDQWNCIDFTAEDVTQTTTLSCYDTTPSCLVKVCMVYNPARSVGGSTCLKGDQGDGDSISHLCDGAVGKDSANTYGCQSPRTGDMDGEGWTTSGIITQCQEGVPGDDLFFILKDGSDQNQTVFDYTTPDDTSGCSPSITCGPADRNQYLACGGSVQSEKLWNYTIPSNFCTNSCGSGGPGPSPSEGPTPAPAQCTVDADCIPATGAYDTGCGSYQCNAGTCVSSKEPEGTHCTAADPIALTGNQASCYQATCNADGQCVDDFKSVDSGCEVVNENLAGLDDDCYESPKCVSVVSPLGAGYTGDYTECKRPFKGSETPCSEDCDQNQIISGECDADDHILFELDGSNVASGTPGARGACHGGDKCGSGADEGKCVTTRKPTSHICRPSKECCDADDYCPAAPEVGRDEFECTLDAPKPVGTPCGEHCPDCAGDVQEVCNGHSKLCPRNVVFQDRLCIYAGQFTHVGSVDVFIYADPVPGIIPTEYQYSYELIFDDGLSTQLDEVPESVKIYIGSDSPSPKPGQFNHKGEAALLTALKGPLSNEGGVYKPCDAAADGFNIAIHLDMADGNTAWAMPCKNCDQDDRYDCTIFDESKDKGHLAEQVFCVTNKKGDEICGASWGRYVTVAPCCFEAVLAGDTCTASCSAPAPTPGPTPGPGPSPSEISCSLECNGVSHETKTCTADSITSISGCTTPTDPIRRNLRSFAF